MSIFLCVLLICAIMHLFLCFLDVLSQDFFSLLLFVSFVLGAERIEMEKRVLLGVLKKNNPIKKNKKRFLKKVVGYLDSDSCMFAPLISTPHTDFLASKSSSSSTAGHSRFIKKITVEVSTRKLTRKDNQPTVETSNVTVQDQFSELPKKGISGQQKFVHKESVKHIAVNICHAIEDGRKFLLGITWKSWKLQRLSVAVTVYED
ncbi:hypothetical protein BDE02_06G153400 [Populus trichocarpa]|nr:hypothetical protein BDE02_06G153400 [Populus trichocarpa]